MNQVMKPIVMGILNVTPDSFADGGRHFGLEAAIERAKIMIAEDVDIIDVGGESTRPGAARISVEEEQSRTIDVIKELATLGAVISIDTTRAQIAKEAIEAGAQYVNDVSGGLADSDMATLIANNPQIQYVVMHWRGHSENMNELATYENVVGEVKDELDQRVSELLKAGVSPEQIILDPGLGCAKDASHNWEILRNLDRLQLLGYPILIGASRKRFLGELLGTGLPDERENASVALTSILAGSGIWGVRTHSVKPHKEAIEVAMELMK